MDEQQAVAEQVALQSSAGQGDLASVWLSLQDMADFDSFAKSWLALQCSMIGGARQGLLVWRQNDGFVPAAHWPESDSSFSKMGPAAELALKKQQGIIQKFNFSATDSVKAGIPSAYHLAYPVIISGAKFGVVALEVTPRSESHINAVMRQLQWGISWLELFELRRRPGQESAVNENLILLTEIMATALTHRGFQTSATSVLTELATRLSCERVAVGFCEGNNVRVRAISHTATFDRRSNQLVAIARCMDEACDQQKSIVYPNPGNTSVTITNAHKALKALSDSSQLCTVPIIENEQVVGAFLFEFSGRAPTELENQREHETLPAFQSVQKDTITLLESLSALAGPLLVLKEQDDQWLGQKAWRSCTKLARQLLGPGHLKLKLATTTLAVLVVTLSLLEGAHRVSAKATLEGWMQRSMVAPFDGYITEVSAQPGDIVNQGQSLYRFDNTDLKLEELKWQNQRLQIDNDYLDALVNHDKALVAVSKARIEQAEASLKLVQEKLRRTSAIAPFDGIIVSGDLSQQVGAPKEKGEVLMEIAPLSDYRIVLMVDERDVRHVNLGQNGELILTSMPDQPYQFSISNITPVAVADQGLNAFRVEAKLTSPNEKLRPGMQGVAKIDIDEKKLIWIWTHKFFEAVRWWLWSWWP